MGNILLGVFFNYSAELILFLSSLVDKSILLIFQAFIYQVKCLEKATYRNYGTHTNETAEWICAVGIKKSNEYSSLEREVSAETSQWVFYAGLCQYLPAFLFGYISGYIGDFYSRKWSLGIPAFGLTVCCWEMFIVANYIRSHYPLILIGYVIFGTFGNIFIFTAACYAIVVHRCNLERPTEKTPIVNEGEAKSNQIDEAAIHKTMRLAILQATTPFGRGFGMLFSGLLLDIIGPAKSFVFVAIVSTVNIIYLIVFMEEIRPDPSNKEVIDSIGNKQEQSEFCKFLKMPYKMMSESYYITFCKPREIIGGLGRLILTLIVLALITYTFCFYLHTFLDYLYLTFSPRNFSGTIYGVFCLVQYTMATVALIVILPAVIYLLRGLSSFTLNILISSFGVVTLALSYLVLASATNTLTVFLSLPLDMFNYWPFAGMRVIISDMVAITELGKVYAVVGSLDNLLAVAATFIYNWFLWPLALSSTVSYPPLPYVVVAILLSVPLSLLLYAFYDIIWALSKGLQNLWRRWQDAHSMNYLCQTISMNQFVVNSRDAARYLAIRRQIRKIVGIWRSDRFVKLLWQF